jgi:hypothetical protein
VLVDPMRGRSSTWTRIRVNLRHVPEDQRPAEEPPDPDYDPWAAWRAQWEAGDTEPEESDEPSEPDEPANRDEWKRDP